MEELTQTQIFMIGKINEAIADVKTKMKTANDAEKPKLRIRLKQLEDQLENAKKPVHRTEKEKELINKMADKIKENASKMGIDINIFESNIFEVVDKSDLSSPCYLCARMRRGCLYNKAKEMGCNKIALGHHFNDVIETSLLNILFAGQTGGMPPKLKSDNFLGMELIRPLYYVKEDDIKSWVNYNNLEFIDCACSITKKKNSSKRKYIKDLIKELNLVNRNADINIFRSLENVNIDTLNGYIKNSVKYDFNDLYKDRK